ncbi:low affinity potassium transporter [Tulasnella sp. 332]|nr:low affinity potassium transporter [Tulasnella sp. 332]
MAQYSHIFSWIARHLNFFRIHVLFFVLAPLIAAVIFWKSSDPNYPVNFIDSLFITVTHITNTGLTTINLSPLTQWQQAMLFIIMVIGDPIAVSWLMVYVRKYALKAMGSFFRRKFGNVIIERMRSRAAKEGVPIPPELEEEVEAQAEGHLRYWLSRLFRRNRRVPPKLPKSLDESSGESYTMTEATGQAAQHGALSHRLTSRAIRRTGDAPKLVNPSGWISESDVRENVQSPAGGSAGGAAPLVPSATAAIPSGEDRGQSTPDGSQCTSSEGADARPPTGSLQPSYDPRIGRLGGQPYRSQSIEFANPLRPSRQLQAGPSPILWDSQTPSPVRRVQTQPEGQQGYISFGGMGPRTDTNLTSPNPLNRITTARPDMTPKSKNSGLGGFPGPFEVMEKAIHHFFPALGKRIDKSINMPRTETLVSMSGPPRSVNDVMGAPLTHTKTVPYLSFDARVGRYATYRYAPSYPHYSDWMVRNSEFHNLTRERLQELGGVEYRALSMLLWILPAYYFGTMLFLFSILAPYTSRQEWHHVFTAQPKFIRPSWFAAFQSVSAFTNTGTSLVDESMVPFANAYTMEIPMFFVIIAGNTGFPVFLRFVIWILSKIVPSKSQAHETLHFLLDHPRRCYIYMFPSHQTWFLLTVLVAMVLTDWISFLVLDIGTPAVEAIPLGTRFAVGLLQAAAVRAAGFAAVALSALAPAVKVLYITMMYVSVYPIALSVRSTNVYEERSLGIFEAHDEEQDKDLEPAELQEGRAKVWGKYLAMHARKQLAFDIWWLGFALWLVCIIERGPLNDPSSQGWFNIFTVLFELVSAYGTVGLSLGLPDQNYSFSGALTPLSKFIVCIVMLRGRHRGLPVAIDRAVLLKGDDFPDSMTTEKQYRLQGRPSQAPLEDARAHNDSTESNEKRTQQATPRRTPHSHHLPLQHPELALRMQSPSNGSAVLAEHLMATPRGEMSSFHHPGHSSTLQTSAQDEDHLDPQPGGSQSPKETTIKRGQVAAP